MFIVSAPQLFCFVKVPYLISSVDYPNSRISSETHRSVPEKRHVHVLLGRGHREGEEHYCRLDILIPEWKY